LRRRSAKIIAGIGRGRGSNRLTRGNREKNSGAFHVHLRVALFCADIVAGSASVREGGRSRRCAGFTPVEAIHITTYNGAQYLGDLDRIGTIVAGKQADLVVIKGDPSKKIVDIENVETVFKDGVGYDSAKLIDSVKGMVGIR